MTRQRGHAGLFTRLALTYFLSLKTATAATPDTTTCIPVSAANAIANGGCSQVNVGVLQDAIAQFDPIFDYGGVPLVTSIKQTGNIFAAIEYLCTDDKANTPSEPGWTIRSQLNNIAACDSVCGTYYTSDSCAFAVLLCDQSKGDCDGASLLPTGKPSGQPTAAELLALIKSLQNQYADLKDVVQAWVDSLSTSTKLIKRDSSSQYEMAVFRSNNLKSNVQDAQGPIETAYAESVINTDTHNTFNELETNIDSDTAALLGASATDISFAKQYAAGILVNLGLLGVLAGILAGAGGGGGGGGNPPTTGVPTATATTTASSTTSSCVATGSATPIIIVTKEGTTEDQFNALVKSLPSNSNNVQRTDAELDNWIYLATIDQCTAEGLWSNSIVQAMATDAEIIQSDAEATDPVGSTKHKKRSRTPEREARYTRKATAKSSRDVDTSTVERDTIRDNSSIGSLQKRTDPDDQTHYVVQDSSPGHLAWISQLSRQTGVTGASYSDFEQFLYDDRSMRSVNPDVAVYVIDTGFNNDHDDFGSRVMKQLSGDNAAQSEAENNHGTCMASLAVGSYSGVKKDAQLITVQLKVNDARTSRVSNAIFTFVDILVHAKQNNFQGRSVVSMSFGGPKRLLWYTPNDPKNTDVFAIYLNLFWKAGIVTVCSAGNFGDHPDANVQRLDFQTPRSNGGSGTPLIVVGNSQPDGTPNAKSQTSDPDGKGILSIYNLGTNVQCAFKTTNNAWGRDPDGTSQATAITAGMIAYFLSNADLQKEWANTGVSNLPMAAKNYLLDLGKQQKGRSWTDGIPRASIGDMVPCQNGVAGPVPIPNFQVPGDGTDLTLQTTPVTNGQTVVFNPLPQCYAL
ncbi:subtilisin-like protein [Mytilinidion resinicola]|uniref:Subtilisin-like protein n=1 Tax=Mytilinidion resinicola TaxID=574789 RepID=A0A6A6YIM3_9PEZI|nr:subtilisin-like protein [Mytilinidion resinicola]KAF2807844.1 subtilisin-like protein [Mytilinidion resinicola]